MKTESASRKSTRESRISSISGLAVISVTAGCITAEMLVTVDAHERSQPLRLLELSQSHRSEHDRKVQEGRSSISSPELASANRKQKLPPPERLECLHRAGERSPL